MVQILFFINFFTVKRYCKLVFLCFSLVKLYSEKRNRLVKVGLMEFFDITDLQRMLARCHRKTLDQVS